MLIRTSLNCVNSMKPSEAYNYLKRNWRTDRFMLESDEVIKPLSLHVLGIKNNSYYTVPEVRNWLKWVNKNIILELGSQNYKTIDVRLRIAVCMLDKLHLSISDRLSILSILTANVRTEISKIAVEDLPF